MSKLIKTTDLVALTNFYKMYQHSKLDEIQDKRGMYFSFDFGWY